MSSRPHLHTVASRLTAAPRGPMSRQNGFAPMGGRGRRGADFRRVQALPVIEVSRQGAMAFWADLVTRRCGTREACAVMFDVRFQTACNWFEGMVCPTGDKVMQAQLWWPEEFAADRAEGAV